MLLYKTNHYFSLSEEKIKNLGKAVRLNLRGRSKYLTPKNIAMFREAVPYLTGYKDSALYNIACRYNLTFDEFMYICKGLYKIYKPYADEMGMSIYEIYLPDPMMYTCLPNSTVYKYRDYYEHEGSFLRLFRLPYKNEELNKILCSIFSKPKLDKPPSNVSYVLYCDLIGMFFAGNSQWVCNINDAKVFKSKKAAQRYLTDTYAYIVPVKL